MAVEMAGPWGEWKTKSRFPTLPTGPWKSRQHREIPTFPPPGFAPDGEVENQNQVSHFPTRASPEEGKEKNQTGFPPSPTRGSRRRPFSLSNSQKHRKEYGRARQATPPVFMLTLHRSEEHTSELQSR